MRKSLLTIAALLFVTLLAGCGAKSQKSRPDTIVVAVNADFDHLNPLLIQMSLAREVCTMIYPSLVRPSFDEKNGAISYQPNAAERWEFTPDGQSVINKYSFGLVRYNARDRSHTEELVRGKQNAVMMELK